MKPTDDHRGADPTDDLSAPAPRRRTVRRIISTRDGSCPCGTVPGGPDPRPLTGEE